MRFYIYAALAIIAGLIISHFYNLESENKSLEFAAAQTKVATDEKKADETATNQAQIKYETVIKKEIEYVDRIVVKKVIEYRDRVPDRCMLHPEWVRTYNLSTEQAGAESATSELDGKAASIGKNAN